MDIKQFYLWLCETIILKQGDQLKKLDAAFILHYARKINAYNRDVWKAALECITTNVEDNKLADLIMAIRAIATLTGNFRK